MKAFKRLIGKNGSQPAISSEREEGEKEQCREQTLVRDNNGTSPRNGRRVTFEKGIVDNEKKPPVSPSFSELMSTLKELAEQHEALSPAPSTAPLPTPVTDLGALPPVPRPPSPERDRRHPLVPKVPLPTLSDPGTPPEKENTSPTYVQMMKAPPSNGQGNGTSLG